MKDIIVLRAPWRMGHRAATVQAAIIVELFPELVDREPPIKMTQAQKDFVKQMQQHRGKDENHSRSKTV